MESLEQIVSQLSEELDCRFPELELQFNLRKDLGHFRIIPSIRPGEVVELDLSSLDTENILNQAIFSLKEMFQLFDA